MRDSGLVRRSRRSAVVALLALLIPSMTPAAAVDGDIQYGSDVDRDGGVKAEVLAPAVSADAAAVAATGGGTQLYWVAIPVWAPSGDPDLNNGYCRGIRYVAGESPEEAEQLRLQGEQEYLALWNNLLANEAPGTQPDVDCPIADGELLPATMLRDAVRGAVVDHLPRPEPEIPPGWALTGMTAYLVTHHELTYGPATHTIDLGTFEVTVEITATGRSTVDWGDGTITTHTVPGTPWPDGEVHHTYRDAGEVTVVVTDRWLVDFTVTSPVTITDSVDAVLAGRSISDLEVRQIQAVRVTADP